MLRYLIPVVLIAAVLFFVTRGGLPRPGAAARPRLAVTGAVEHEPPAVRIPHDFGSAETVLVQPDPSEDLHATLAACEAARAAVEVDRDALRGQVVQLELELEQLRFPEDTPYGAFLRSPEAEAITETTVRARIREWLGLFPLSLMPGEATWIAERTRRDDWLDFARTSERAIIDFLGAARIVASLSPERLAELREDYAGEGVFD